MKKLILLIILFTNFLHAQWIQTSGPINVGSFAISGMNLFAGTYDKGVFLSTNNGTNWTAIDSGLMNTAIHCFAISGTNLFAGTNGGLFLSTNNGTSWAAVDSGLTETSVNALAVSPNGTGDTDLFVATESPDIGFGNIFLSTDNGTHWTRVNTGFVNMSYCLFVSGTNLFSATGGGPYLSTNDGTSWTAIDSGLTYPYGYVINMFAVSGTNLFAGSADGVFLSTNNGTNWTAVDSGLTGNEVNALAVSGTSLFAGIYSHGVFLSTNNGTSWSAVNTGLTNTAIHCFAVCGTNLFVGTNAGVWRRPLSEMITGVEDVKDEIPNVISLQQNYPNPFNPSTSIGYNIPERLHVTLVIYDVLGREISTLVNEVKIPGRYNIKFDASRLSSGVYFYQLRAGNYVSTKKMVLLK